MKKGKLDHDTNIFFKRNEKEKPVWKKFD